LLCVSQVSAAWNEIPGDPEPSFGPNVAAPALPGNWTNEVSGFYFVDPSCLGGQQLDDDEQW
jgi:hypothetical protein